MKILIINDTIERIGGTEQHCYSLKNLLESKGHQVKIFGKRTFEAFPSFLLRFFDPFIYFQSLKLIKSFDPDVVHVHGLSRNISPSPILAAKKYNKKVVMSFHDFHLYCPKTWAIYQDGKPCKFGYSTKCLYSNCKTFNEGYKYIPYHLLKWLKVGLHRQLIKKYVDRFIASSNKLKELIQYSLKIPDQKIIYLPYFTDLEKNVERNIDNIKPNQFLYVGRLSKEKGINILIEAIHLLVKKNKLNVKLIIIGDGHERTKLKRLTYLLGLEKYIVYLGKLPKSKLYRYYLESLAVIIPSICMDNSPLVAYEAMSYHVPIIASNIGGIPDLVKNNKNGFLFEPGNKKILADYLLKLYKNIKLSKNLGNEGYNMIKIRFNKEIYYKKLMEIYR